MYHSARVLAPASPATPRVALVGIQLMLLLALARPAAPSTSPPAADAPVTFQPEGIWTDATLGSADMGKIIGSGTSVLEWGIPFNASSFPSRLTFRAASSATAKLLPDDRVSVPFVLGDVELRNGIITGVMPASCWFLVDGRFPDLESNAGGILPMERVNASRFPVQLDNTANIEGDPIASADRVGFGSIQGVLPPSVYHRTIAVPELQTGHATLYARLRSSISTMRLDSNRYNTTAPQWTYSIELLGFGDAADSASFPATSRAMDVAIEAGNRGEVLLPTANDPMRIVIRGTDALPIESIDRDQLLLVGAMAIPIRPLSIEAADVAGGHGPTRPDGRLDLVLEFAADDVARTVGTLEDARSADVVNGKRRVPLALFARTSDGEELRSDVSMLFAGSAQARDHRAISYVADAAAFGVGAGLQLTTRNLAGRVDATLAGAPGQDVRFSIYDARGRRMAEQHCRSAMDGRVYFAWSTGAVSPGIYFLRAQSEAGVANAKLVVVR